MWLDGALAMTALVEIGGATDVSSFHSVTRAHARRDTQKVVPQSKQIINILIPYILYHISLQLIIMIYNNMVLTRKNPKYTNSCTIMIV